ncbi:MAG: ABC transporter substrate-binding protein, partial [Xanthobacteraceae bacterium]
GAAATWPLAARAQQPGKMPRVGMLLAFAESDPTMQARLAAFRQGLAEFGWSDGRNVRLDFRFAGSDIERFRVNAAELVALAPDLMFAHSNPALAALRQENRTIPTVFVQVADPVGSGFVQSLARPGGNATGFTNFEPATGGKWVEILKEIAPGVSRAVVLMHPETAANVALFHAAEAAGLSLGVTVAAAGVRAVGIEQAITSFAREPNGGLIALPHVVTAGHRELIARLAIEHRLPSVGSFGFMAASGGLISYGIDVIDLFRRSAAYVDRILRGEKPANLPVQAPVKFELVVNLKTAKALGLTVPPMLLARADEVIE